MAGERADVRSAGRVIAVNTARSAARSAVLWGLVFGCYVAYAAVQYATSYPSLAGRQQVAATLGANPGMVALFGQGQHLATVAGFTAWRAMGVLTPLGAIWGLLTATRLTRGEEEAGRLELLLAGQTTRGRAVGQAIAGLGAGLAVLWAITAAIIIAAGSTDRVRIPVGGALFLTTAVISTAAMFMAVGMLVAQLTPSRRPANAVAATILGASLLLRIVADSGSGVGWLRWATPLGWAEQLHPLTAPNPVAFAPIIALIALLTAAASALATRRDLGAGALPTRKVPRTHTNRLRGPTSLTIALTRPMIIGWAAGLAVLGLVGGLVAPSTATAIGDSTAIEQTFGRLGATGSAAYLAIIYLIGAALVSLAAAGQITAMRTEEASGYLDHLLARPLARWRWLAGRLAAAAALIIIASTAAGLAGWLGIATQQTDLGFGQLLQAGLNMAPPALLILGLGSLAYGLWPRQAPTITYGLVAWSFLIEVMATVVTNRWLLDTSVLHHIAAVPAAEPNWTSAAWLTGLAILLAITANILFNRRDLASA